VLKNRTLIAIAQGVFELAIEQPSCVSHIRSAKAERLVDIARWRALQCGRFPWALARRLIEAALAEC
jgi:hypothetical protein